MTETTLTADPETADANEPEGPGRVRRFASALWRIVRLLVVVGLVGALVYYGWPIVNERFVAPVATNSAELGETRTRLDDAEQAIALLEARLQELTDREAGLPDRLVAAELALASATDLQSELESDLESLDRRISAHSTRLDDIDALQAEMAGDFDARTIEFVRELQLVRVMELLSRARLFLFEANYGLAANDIDAARLIVLELQRESIEWNSETVSEVVFRLDKSLNALPGRPVVAAADLDIAWQVLLGGLSEALPIDIEADAEPTPDTAGG